MTACRTIELGRNIVACLLYGMWLSGVQLRAEAASDGTNAARPVLLFNPPEARPPLVLKAINDPNTGKGSFLFEGREDPPVIRARPGEDIRLTYVNEMSTHSRRA